MNEIELDPLITTPANVGFGVHRWFAGNAAGLCSGKEIPVYITAADVFDASLHVLRAIAGHVHWTQLNKGPNNAPPRWFAQAQYGVICYERQSTGNDCHDYPYISTTRGGPGLGSDPEKVTPVALGQDRSQGNSLKTFYGACGIDQRADHAFGVLPIPIVGVPSGSLARR